MMKITFKEKPVTLLGRPVAVGLKAPDFSAVHMDLSPFNLSSLDEGKITVISAAPSIDTNTCSLQAIRFNQEALKYKDQVNLVTITLDLPFAQRRYCAAEGIDNMTVVSDYQDREFGLKYGFLMDELKLLTRGVVIIDRDQVVKYVQYVSEVANEPDYDAVLEAIEALI